MVFSNSHTEYHRPKACAHRRQVDGTRWVLLTRYSFSLGHDLWFWPLAFLYPNTLWRLLILVPNEMVPYFQKICSPHTFSKNSGNFGQAKVVSKKYWSIVKAFFGGSWTRLIWALWNCGIFHLPGIGSVGALKSTEWSGLIFKRSSTFDMECGGQLQVNIKDLEFIFNLAVFKGDLWSSFHK